MKNLTLKYMQLVAMLKDEQGQDLIEYALVVALIAFAAVSGMNALATGINTAFNNVSLQLASYIKS